MTDSDWIALRLSLQVAATATALALPLALTLAWLLARRRFYGKAALELALQLPLVLPPVVPGYLLLLLLGGRGPLGRWLEAWGLGVAFRWQGAAIAAVIMALPLMVQALRLGLVQVDGRLEQAAKTLGASGWQVFCRITLPLIAPHLLVAALLGFCRSLGEFGATMTFVGNVEGETRTLALALYSYSHQPDGEAGAIRLILVSLGLAVAALTASYVLRRRAEAHLAD